jgi:hypothetical protein
MFGDAKGVIRRHELKKDGQYNGEKKKDAKTKVHKTLNRKLKIEQRELH